MSQKSQKRALLSAIKDALEDAPKHILEGVAGLLIGASDWLEGRNSLLVGLADAGCTHVEFADEQAAAVKARDERRDRHKQSCARRNATDEKVRSSDVSTATPVLGPSNAEFEYSSPT